jgi:pyruvate,orthophosphate dikinase
VQEQLWGAIGAVFSSWMNQRAIVYRRLHEIPGSWGTAVNVQAMVFGNMGNDCGDGRGLHAQPFDRRNLFMANSWSMRRAKMWWPASAHRSR